MRFQFQSSVLVLFFLAVTIEATFPQDENSPSGPERRSFKSKHYRRIHPLKKHRRFGGWLPHLFGRYSDDSHPSVYRVHRYRGIHPVTATSDFPDQVSYHVSGPSASSHFLNYDHGDQVRVLPRPSSDEFHFSDKEKPISTSHLTYAPHHDYESFSVSLPLAHVFDHHFHPVHSFVSNPLPVATTHFTTGHSSFSPNFPFFHPLFSSASVFPVESHSIQLPPSHPPLIPAHVQLSTSFPDYHHSLPSFPSPALTALPPLPAEIPAPVVTTTDSPISSSVLHPPAYTTVSLQQSFPGFSSNPAPTFPFHQKPEYPCPPSNTVPIPASNSVPVPTVSFSDSKPEKVEHPHQEPVHENDNANPQHQGSSSATSHHGSGLLDKLKSWKAEKAGEALNHLHKYNPLKHFGIAEKTSVTSSSSDHPAAPSQPTTSTLRFPETVHVPSADPQPQMYFPPLPSSQSDATQYEQFSPNQVRKPSQQLSLFDSYGVPIPLDAYSLAQHLSHDRVSSAASEEKASVLPAPSSFAEETPEEKNAEGDEIVQPREEDEPEIVQEFQDLQRIHPKLHALYRPKDKKTGEEESKKAEEEIVETTRIVNQEETESQIKNQN